MSAMRDERGFTLVELLLVCVLMLVITGAVLTTLEHNVTGNRRNQLATQDGEAARNAADLVARDARNASAYTTAASAVPTSVLRADPQDFVFKTVDPTAAATTGNDYRIRTVRYCYAASSRRLVRQVKADVATPAAACPDPAFSTTASVGAVANGTRALFSYDSAVPGWVTRVGFDLYVDSTPGKAPAEAAVHSGVFLRNTNRPPTAAFDPIALPGRHVQLNATASSDPDGGVLSYAWTDNGTALVPKGPVVDYVAPASGARTFTLVVTDRDGLTATTQQTVTVLP